MAKSVSILQVKKGVIISVAAQAISLSVSLVLNLIVPKCIDEYQYAYWQTYMLYISYVGILHFGILDGIVLRYAQFDYEELDKALIRSQFVVLLLLDSSITLVMIGFALAFAEGITQAVVILVALGVVTRNVFTYTSYTFQVTNRINKYAILIIAQRLFYGIGILVLLVIGVRSFVFLCLIDLMADLFGIMIGARFNQGLYFGPLPGLKSVRKEVKANLSAGVLLLIANWASNLLIGSAKMVVQWRWDALVFGKVSFAFSVSNLFLTFVTAISVVLFPSLKRMKQEELPGLYKKIRGAISPLLFAVMLFYFPGCVILRLWLPRYAQSLRYLGILLPIIVFASKVSLLTNNYLKAYRKERAMLRINIFSIAVGLLVYFGCAYLLNSLELLLIGIVTVVMMRSILSEIVVSKVISASFSREFLSEGLMTAVFLLCTSMLELKVGFFVYLVSIALYCATHFRDIKSMIPSLHFGGKGSGK